MILQAALEYVVDIGAEMGRYVLGVKKKLLNLMKRSEMDTISVWFVVDNHVHWEYEVRKAVVLRKLD